jgi:hypothetical protein
MFKNPAMGVEKIRASRNRAFFENLGTSPGPPLSSECGVWRGRGGLGVTQCVDWRRRAYATCIVPHYKAEIKIYTCSIFPCPCDFPSACLKKQKNIQFQPGPNNRNNWELRVQTRIPLSGNPGLGTANPILHARSDTKKSYNLSFL